MHQCVKFYQSKICCFNTDSALQNVLHQELVTCWCSHVKGQHFEHKVLHTQELLFGVGVICDVDKFIHLWRINFFIFPKGWIQV